MFEVIKFESVSMHPSQSLFNARRSTALPKLIVEVMKKHPQLRLGQLISNAAVIASSGTDIFFVNDTAMAEGLRDVLNPPDGVEDKAKRIFEIFSMDDDVTNCDRDKVMAIIREKA